MDILGTASGFFAWLGRFIHENPWPTITIILIFFLIFVPWTRFVTKDLIRSLGIKKLKFTGTEIEFGREDKLVVQRTLGESLEIIKQYRKKVDNNIDRLIRKTALHTAFREAAAAIFETQFRKKFGIQGMRATLHVQDFVFEDRLYQIMDYYPAGGGAHRHFSLRRGIIGRVWRSQIVASAGFLTHRVAPEPLPNEKNVIDAICLQWGLTEMEAIDFKKAPSYCCVPIKDGHRMLGVFYMDCNLTNFGWDDTENVESKLKVLQDFCLREVQDKKLPSILSLIENEMADYSPRISLDG